MGYTHYWRRPELIKEEDFKKIVKDFKKVLPYITTAINLAGGEGRGEPELTDEVVRFNGVNVRDEWGEKFEFNRDAKKDSFPYCKDDVYYESCKTYELPYDLAVQVFLIIAKHHAKVQVRSDGMMPRWRKAIKIVKNKLHYGNDFILDPPA